MDMQIRINHLLLIILSAILGSFEIATAHDWMAPKVFSFQKNPIPYSAESISQGEELYLDNCAACHGDTGKGLSAKEVNLKKSPPNLLKRLATHSDGDFFWKIGEGRGEMPSFKGDLEDKDVWDIINYLRSAK